MYSSMRTRWPAIVLVVLSLLEVGNAHMASFAANVQPLTTTADPVRYDVIIINRGNALNQDVWRLYIPADGLYLTTLTAGHYGSGYGNNYRLRERGQVKTLLYRSGASSAGTDTMGMDIISWYNGGQDLDVALSEGRLESTQDGLHTSWGTFSLSGQMGTNVGFGVARTSGHGSGRVSFPTVWGNVGNGWNSNTNEFVVSEMGIYFFSFSTGVQQGNRVRYALRINGGSPTFEIYRVYPTSISLDTIGRAAMMYLYPGDRVEIYSHYTGYSDGGYLTNFNGFQYNTMRPERAAWAAYRTSSLSGSYDPLPFTLTTVNEGGVWLDNRAYCPFTGVYYVHISVGVQPSQRVLVTIMKDNLSIGELRRDSTAHSGIDTLSRSLLVECRSEESIRVITSSNTYLYSDGDMQTGFLGFYLFE